MKQITKDSIHAFLEARPFSRQNMRVTVAPNVTTLYLDGNAIAYRYNDPKRTLSITTAGGDTLTTRARLNGIPGVTVYHEKGVCYLNGEKWDGELIDIK